MSINQSAVTVTYAMYSCSMEHYVTDRYHSSTPSCCPQPQRWLLTLP